MLTRNLGKLSIPVVPKIDCQSRRVFYNFRLPGLVRRLSEIGTGGAARPAKLISIQLVLPVTEPVDPDERSTMTLTPFETNLYQYLTPFFERHQYRLLPDMKQYRRNTRTGFQNVILSPSFYGGETMLEVNFGCRNDQIEQIAQQFLTNLVDFRPNANTVIISIGKFSGYPYYRYKIHSDDELADTCQQIEQFFTTRGFDFLNGSSTLPTLDRLLNEHPDQPCPYVYNQAHRCYKGLIAARLNNSPRFDGLIDSYRQLLIRQTQNPYEQLHFERLIAYLQHYSPN